MRIRFYFISAVFITLFAALPTSIRSDVVHLKNGRSFHNVKTLNQGDSLFLVFAAGRVKRLRPGEIKKVVVKPVRWKKSVSRARLERLIREAVRRETEDMKKSVRKEMKKTAAQAARTETNRLRRLDEQKRALLQKREREKSRRRWNAFFRSAILPGWGQYYRGDTVQGLGYLAGSLFFLTRHRGLRRAHAKTQREYSDAVPPLLGVTAFGPRASYLNYAYLRDRRRVLLLKERAANRVLGLLGAVYALNLLDAAFLNGPAKSALARSDGSRKYAGLPGRANGFFLHARASFLPLPRGAVFLLEVKF